VFCRTGVHGRPALKRSVARQASDLGNVTHLADIYALGHAAFE
jgi:hypothetical protein